MKIQLRAIVVFIAISMRIGVAAQNGFTIEQILSPAFPYEYELVAAKKVDRIAWLANERGMRNVYTAVAPNFKPVRLTKFLEDDGIEVRNLRISDDGSVVVFQRGGYANRDGWIANPTSDPRGGKISIWAVKTNGGKSWILAEARGPVLSPSGEWVLFVRDGQILRIPVDPKMMNTENRSEPTSLFRVFGNNYSPSWSPDSKRIAFVSNRDDHSYIGIYDLENEKLSYLSPGVDRDSSPTWSQDGKSVAFIRKPGAPFGNQGSPHELHSVPGLTSAAFRDRSVISIWVANLESGRTREIWRNPSTDFKRFNTIWWAGDNIVFIGARGNWAHTFSVSLSTQSEIPTDLTPGNGSARHDFSLSNDGNHLFYQSNIGDINRSHVWKSSTSGGGSSQLTRGNGIETHPVALSSGAQVAIQKAGARKPQSVALIPSTGGDAHVIFPELPPDFPHDQLVIPKDVVLTAEDGLQFHNQLFVPKGISRGERRPAILFVHGGPARQMLLGFHDHHFYHMAYAMNQYFVNLGYVVMSVDYRGSNGYGFRFLTASWGSETSLGGYVDVVAAGQYLQSRADVDPKRIGLWGASHGGYLTAQGLARNSDIFAAGVDIAGIHLRGGALNPKSASYQSSPISQIGKWKSPVLLVHGDDDRSVPFSQTTGLVQLLRAHDIHYELIVFPDDVHASPIHKRWLTTFNAMEDFFRRFLAKGKQINENGRR
jgi:dipeptidyl aminopeptidase/acylaminoacyl peptidase